MSPLTEVIAAMRHDEGCSGVFETWRCKCRRDERREEARAELTELRDGEERERMRLSACGIAARGGSVEHIAPVYKSDSLSAVLELRAELDALRAALKSLRRTQHDYDRMWECSAIRRGAGYPKECNCGMDEQNATIVAALRGTP